MTKKVTFVSILLLLFTLLSAQQTAIRAADFGASVNDSSNDRAALQQAVDYCINNNISTLILDPGSYILSSDDAVELEKRVYSGKFPNVPEELYTPYYAYSSGISIEGALELSIVSEGTTLLCEGWMEPLTIRNSSRVTLKGITIDYKRRPNSIGKVIAAGSGTVDIDFGVESGLSSAACFPRMTFWNKETGIIFSHDLYVKGKEDLRPGVIRFNGRIPGGIEGLDAVAVHSLHFRPAILLDECRDVRIEDFTIHSQPGMGIVGNRTENISMENLAVIPAEGEYQSTNTDATHFTSCSGKISFNNCRFKGQGDDATNIHGFYHSIFQGGSKNEYQLSVIWNPKDRSSVMNTHASVLDYPSPGDKMALVKRRTLEVVREYEVQSVKRVPTKWLNQITLNESLPERLKNYFLINTSRMPSVEITNCSVDSSLARGFLIKTSNVLIENNRVENITGTAVQLSAEGDWLEGMSASNVIIRNNRFIRCGRGSGTQMATAGITVNTKAPDAHTPGLHRNLIIENNEISGEGARRGIYISSSDGVTLKNNRISGVKIPVDIRSSVNVEQ